MNPTRRTVVGGLAAAGVIGARTHPAARLADLERRSGGRLGVCILETATGRTIGHRADERFGMCSTFKLPLAAVTLAEIDAGRLRADTVLPFGPVDLVTNSPVTRENVEKGGMTVVDLAKATQQTSDNTAANLLIRLLGGPAGVTAKWRALGDGVSRLDRYEPAMNLVLPGESHDTTTPRGMATGMRAYLVRRALRPAARDMLIGWMVDTRTGARRIRAGLPSAWRTGDKTGTLSPDASLGIASKYNDAAIIFPPRRAPMIVTAYLEARARFETIRPEDEAILAEVGGIAASL